jgi:O-antigen/teichoic acid export membrane protein
MDLAGRTVTALSWNVAVSGVTAVVLLVRTSLLTRWVSPHDFGTYTLAYALVATSSVFAGFGLSKAFLHRAAETHDERQAASIHFTLQTLFASAWCLLVLTCTLLFAQGDLRLALLVVTPAIFGVLLTQTPRAIFVRRVQHRRLAVLTLVNILASTAVALPLAYNGAGLWALLATDVVAVVVHLIVLYGWKPVWKPSFGWSRASVRYFLRFGGQNVLADLATQLTDRLDDIWTGVYLGRSYLGHYSRAFAFAGHPARLISGPVSAVAGGTFAELKGNRLGLSKAFFRVSALLVRVGFFIAGLLFLIMPEFIRIVLTDVWWPMLPAFRWLILLALLNPIKQTLADLYIAVGKPGRVAASRFVQLVTLTSGLYVLGTVWDIAGVAIAVDVSLVTGIAFLLGGVRRYVTLSVRKLLLVPSLALIVAAALPYSILWALPSLSGNPWSSGTVKVATFSVVYLLISMASEWRDWARMLSAIRRALHRDEVQSSISE